MTTETAQPAESNAEQQARLQLESIREMLAAVAVDYDRLEELREEKADADDDTSAVSWAEENPDEAAELAELEAAAGDCKDQDEAEQRIYEDPLSVQVRGGWYTPGEEKPDPEEFEILLCTGGPAVRILGELGEGNEPTRAWLEYQDWGTPWQTLYLGDDASKALLDYAGHFYFGE
jgi:hypothetical protein